MPNNYSTFFFLNFPFAQINIRVGLKLICNNLFQKINLAYMCGL